MSCTITQIGWKHFINMSAKAFSQPKDEKCKHRRTGLFFVKSYCTIQIMIVKTGSGLVIKRKRLVNDISTFVISVAKFVYDFAVRLFGFPLLVNNRGSFDFSRVEIEVQFHQLDVRRKHQKSYTPSKNIVKCIVLKNGLTF